MLHVDAAEAVGGVTREDARVGGAHGPHPQHGTVHAVALPAEMDRVSVLGPRDERRLGRRVDRARQTQVGAGWQHPPTLV